LLAQGRWFSPGTPASSTTKTGRHDIAEILLKVAFLANGKYFLTRIYIWGDLALLSVLKTAETKYFIFLNTFFSFIIKKQFA
jgi:hypothetical protein